MKVYRKTLPTDSLIAKALERIDYEDNFATIVRGSALPLEKLPKLFFKSFPKWFLALMLLREKIGAVIGLKTATGLDVPQQLQDFTGKVGESIALFHVMGRSEEELLTGENDSHLDFRLSFFVKPQGNESEISLSTTVQYNSWVGRLYFLPVKPIHNLVMPVILRRMAQRFEREQMVVDPVV